MVLNGAANRDAREFEDPASFDLDRSNARKHLSFGFGIHTCPGGDQDSTHSLDVPYRELLPSLLQLKAGNFYIQLASEKDPRSVLEVIRDHAQPNQRIFIGVIDPIDPRVETAEEVRDRVLQAAEYIPVDRLGSTDDCGFAPFGDDTSTPRETAFAKIRARVEGTRMASVELGIWPRAG
jgi:5-methyltetrahydropteroyltriglutamate--homocysteine methyltransferase